MYRYLENTHLARRLHCGKLTLKIYTKGERVLRIETVVHNTKELRCGRSLQYFPQIVIEARGILERFMNALSCIDQCFIADRMLEQLPAPSQVGKTTVGGVDLHKPRMRWLIEALIALSPFPGGFTASALTSQVRLLSQQSESEYGPRRAAYDLKKLRGKKVVQRIGQTRRYESIPKGIESDGRAGSAEEQSDQAAARFGAGASPLTRRAKSFRHRHALQHDPHSHARRVSGAGPGPMKIDNYFVGLRP